MAKIFINYRRDDTIATAGRLHDRLAKAFGRNNIFMDVDHIPAGVDFVTHLEAQVSSCEVLVAMIGPRWLDLRDAGGRRRIDDPKDFVALEIAGALARGLTVVPVLIDGARMPAEAELPESLKALARRNAIEVRNTQFGSDAERLVEKISALVKPGAFGLLRWAGASAAVLVLAATGWLAYRAAVPPTLPKPVKSVESVSPAPAIVAAPPFPSPSPPSPPPTRSPAVPLYCDGMKRVLAAADSRFESLLGKSVGANRIALVALTDWEDCTVFMEGKVSGKRSYACSLAGFPDKLAAEAEAQKIAEGLSTACLGPGWEIKRSFDTDGTRRTRMASASSSAIITLRPRRLPTDPDWRLVVDVE